MDANQWRNAFYTWKNFKACITNYLETHSAAFPHTVRNSAHLKVQTTFPGCSCCRPKTKHFQKMSHCYASVLFLQKCLLLQLESGVWTRQKIHWIEVQVGRGITNGQVYVNCLRLLLPIATHQRVFPMDSCDAPLRKNWSAARILFLILMSPTNTGHQSD